MDRAQVLVFMRAAMNQGMDVVPLDFAFWVYWAIANRADNNLAIENAVDLHSGSDGLALGTHLRAPTYFWSVSHD